MNEHLIGLFQSFEDLAKGGKFTRWMHRPIGYPTTMGFTYLVFPLIKRKWKRTCKTFWGDRMVLPLPAGLDIFLTGGKGHDSELRLANWMIRHLDRNDVILDIGAHLGYFSLLALAATGGTGEVVAFEPGEEVRGYLDENVRHKERINVYPFAVSDANKRVIYQSHTIEMSESNRLVETAVDQSQLPPRTGVKTGYVDAVSLDTWQEHYPCSPTFMKIDAEGSEADILAGAKHLLETSRPWVSMEFHASQSVRGPYVESVRFMAGLGYTANEIRENGKLKPVRDILMWADQLALDSDNLVFSPSPG